MAKVRSWLNIFTRVSNRIPSSDQEIVGKIATIPEWKTMGQNQEITRKFQNSEFTGFNSEPGNFCEFWVEARTFFASSRSAFWYFCDFRVEANKFLRVSGRNQEFFRVGSEPRNFFDSELKPGNFSSSESKPRHFLIKFQDGCRNSSKIFSGLLQVSARNVF